MEDFLVDHQSENIDINDLNELDTLIGISINHKKEFQDKELLKSASEGNYLQSTSPSNSLTVCA